MKKTSSLQEPADPFVPRILEQIRASLGHAIDADSGVTQEVSSLVASDPKLQTQTITHDGQSKLVPSSPAVKQLFRDLARADRVMLENRTRLEIENSLNARAGETQRTLGGDFPERRVVRGDLGLGAPVYLSLLNEIAPPTTGHVVRLSPPPNLMPPVRLGILGQQLPGPIQCQINSSTYWQFSSASRFPERSVPPYQF